MPKLLLVLFMLFGAGCLSAQELNCQVVLNTEQTGQSNLSVFRTLERSLSEFINRTSWTDQDPQNHERIDCSMFITINSFEGESFSGTIQVQSSRPVYGSTFVTPVFNFNDEQFAFNYREFQPLNYSRNSFSSNLVSVVAFYAYTIIGLDADTFAQEGGTPYFQEANQIVMNAQQSGNTGWGGNDGNRSRYRLNTDLLSNAFAGYRTALYEYHRLGLDEMHRDQEKAKNSIVGALEKLEHINARRANALLLRTFMDAKADELTQILSGGPPIDHPRLKEILNTIAPRYSRNWNRLE